jgi:CubicO group peptidase (beta-lactamase class C family)/pimeloyl-ACP methyl ester carboxylesterase
MITLIAAMSMTPYNFGPLTARIDSWVSRGYYPGASIIVKQDRKVLYENSFGDYTPDTVVLIASAGKWLAAATIATVVDEGKLSWSDRVDKWLPQFKDAKGSATLRQLLSHTSGFPDYQPSTAHVDDYASLTESVSHIVDLPPTFAPGTHFQYGGLAMQVAGRMAELATGKEWETLFEERLASPLGMRSTRFLPIDKTGGHSPMLGGGARSTAHDYIRFLEMIMHEGVFEDHRILSQSAIREMQADQVHNAKMSEERYVTRACGGLHNGVYGLGEWREKVDAQGNATLISSPSWAGAYPWIDKTRGIYGFFIAHVDGTGKARTDGFNSFYSSPILADLVARAVDQSHEGVKTGKIDGLAYEEGGRGEPLILLHAHSVDRRMWDDQFALLSKRYRVIRYDMRGYGESDDPSPGVAFTHAEDLRRLMDDLHIQKAHLVGLSLGGLVGTDFLALYPQRVLSLTAAAGAIHDAKGIDTESQTERDARHARETAAKVAEAQQISVEGLDRYRKQWLAALDSSAADPLASRAHIWRMVDDWTVWQKRNIEGYPLLDLPVARMLKEKAPTVPVLLIVGAHDSLGSKNSSAALAAVLPQAKTVVLLNAGHFSNLEDPKAFDHALTSFLKSISQERANR